LHHLTTVDEIASFAGEIGDLLSNDVAQRRILIFSSLQAMSNQMLGQIFDSDRIL
jgi:hypothetical protein